MGVVDPNFGVESYFGVESNNLGVVPNFGVSSVLSTPSRKEGS